MVEFNFKIGNTNHTPIKVIQSSQCICNVQISLTTLQSGTASPYGGKKLFPGKVFACLKIGVATVHIITSYRSLRQKSSFY